MGKSTLLDQLKAMPAPGNNMRRFLKDLSPAELKELEQVRDAFNSGELPGWTVKSLYDYVIGRGFKINGKYERFRRWLRKDGYSPDE